MLKVKFKNVYGKTIGVMDANPDETPDQLCLRAEEMLINHHRLFDGDHDSTFNWDGLAVRMELILDTRTKCDCTPWHEPLDMSTVPAREEADA